MKQSTQFIVVDYSAEHVPTSQGGSLDISTVMRHPAIPPAARNS
jgi:hypothetical protein